MPFYKKIINFRFVTVTPLHYNTHDLKCFIFNKTCKKGHTMTLNDLMIHSVSEGITKYSLINTNLFTHHTWTIAFPQRNTPEFPLILRFFLTIKTWCNWNPERILSKNQWISPRPCSARHSDVIGVFITRKRDTETLKRGH